MEDLAQCRQKIEVNSFCSAKFTFCQNNSQGGVHHLKEDG